MLQNRQFDVIVKLYTTQGISKTLSVDEFHEHFARESRVVPRRVRGPVARAHRTSSSARAVSGASAAPSGRRRAKRSRCGASGHPHVHPSRLSRHLPLEWLSYRLAFDNGRVLQLHIVGFCQGGGDYGRLAWVLRVGRAFWE